MTREATVELLSRFLDGDVDTAEEAWIEQRLDSDAEAREIYDGLRRIRGALGELAGADAPPAYLGALVHRSVAMEAEKTGMWNRIERRLRGWLAEPMMLPAFAVVLALAAMFYLLANGLARFERAREPLFLSAPPGTAPGPETVLLDGRAFVRQGERWVESGLAPAAVEGAPRWVVEADEIGRWVHDRPQLAPLVELEVVVVELDGEVVELVFAAGRE